jgi:hypothetical protein
VSKWGFAKSRFGTELTNKNELINLISEHPAIGLKKSHKKFDRRKILWDKDDFLNSDSPVTESEEEEK